MKYLLAVLVIVPSVSLATPVDSMFGPFKLPLKIGVTVNGRFYGSAGAGAYPHPESFGDTFNVTAPGMQTHVHAVNADGWHGVDTSQTFVIGDTVRYEYWSVDTMQGHSELIFSSVDKGFDI